MSDIDDLVRRTVNGVTLIAGKAAAFSTRLLIMVVVVCVGGFLLGVEALSGGIETVWIVLAFTFGAIAIGCAFVARWRVGSVRRHIPELADEVRTLATEDPNNTRTVVETFVIDTDADGNPIGGDGSEGSAIVLSRQMGGFSSVAASSAVKDHTADRGRPGDDHVPVPGARCGRDQRGVRVPRVHLPHRARPLSRAQGGSTVAAWTCPT